tara:strand:- start:1052 stop:1276 length:225 start_codon:yes stop_codon:yes gene_type:complete
MKNLIRLLFVSLLFGLLISCSDNNETEKPKEKTSAEIRLEKQSQSVKNCVRTFGQGVYKDKSLSWKLDGCNASN